MKQYTRPVENKPKKFCDDNAKTEYYNDLYSNDGKIKARWNTLQENNQRAVRKYLLSITNNSCIYCGKKINDGKMDVEHFLPSSAFPYLSYCLDNLLPSCKECNQNRKGAFIPDEIKDMKIVEACIKDTIEHDKVYDKQEVLNKLCKNSRIIEPTFDNIEEHIEFNPECFFYETKSAIGKKTNEMFFDNPEFIKELEEISEVVKSSVKKYDDCYDIIENFIIRTGQEFYYNKFYEYWINEKNHNRI